MCAAMQVWQCLSKELLQSCHPFPLHKLLFEATYEGWSLATLGPPPIWAPRSKGAVDTNAARLMRMLAKESSAWRSRMIGDLQADWSTLQMLSFEEPEWIWPAVLRELRIEFVEQPCR